MTYYMPDAGLSIALAQNVGPTSTFVNFEQVLNIVFNQFKVDPFEPMVEIINENYNRGLHLRVKGKLAKSAVEPSKMPSTIGYAFDSKRFVPGQSFNQFYLETIELENEEWIRITGISMSLFASLSASGQAKMPMSMVLVKKSALTEARANGKDYLSTRGNLDTSPIFAVTGSLSQSSGTQPFEACASRIIESKRLLNLQFGTNLDEHFNQGETIKILSNIPLRNAYHEDFSLLGKFGIKLCSENPVQQS